MLVIFFCSFIYMSMISCQSIQLRMLFHELLHRIVEGLYRNIEEMYGQGILRRQKLLPVSHK